MQPARGTLRRSLMAAAGSLLAMAAGATAEPRRPLVLLPGITGTALVDREDGTVAWGRGLRLLLPRDRGHALALPDRPADRRLTPGAVIEFLRIYGVYRFEVYGPLFEAFEAAGYRRGDLRNPRADADLYVFAYDWRDDAVAVAADLVEQLEGLRRARGEEVLEIDLLAQSGAARIARYAVRHGGASRAAAEIGLAGPADGWRVRHLIFVGAPHGGSLRTLRLLLEGRRYLPFGRRFAPEVFLTFPALLQDLPAPGTRPFVDGMGNAVALDLFDPATWRRFGWGLDDPRLAAGRRRGRAAAAVAVTPERRAWFAAELQAARRLHELLAAPAHIPPETRIHVVLGQGLPTPALALVDPATAAPGIRFAGQRGLRHAPWEVDGDGHATVASQHHLAAEERERITTPPITGTGGHFELILDPEVQQRLLAILFADPAASPGGEQGGGVAAGEGAASGAPPAVGRGLREPSALRGH